MKLQHVIEAVFCQPWAIVPAAHASIRALVESKLNGGSLDALSNDRDGADNAPRAQFIGDTAILPIVGVLVPHATLLQRTCGAIGCSDIDGMIDQAQARGSQTIIFDFDSPGGSITQVAELASRIASLPERTVAFTAGTMGSAAYWLGCSCDEVIATPSSQLGAIGVFNAQLDQSAAYEARGLKIEMFKSGDLKGTGFPGTSLSAEQRAYLQEQVDEIFVMFRGHVEAHRPRVSADVFRGQAVFGNQALALGLVDKIVNNIKDVLDGATPRASTKSSTRATSAAASAPDWRTHGFSSPENFEAYQRHAHRIASYDGAGKSLTRGRMVNGQLVIE